MLNAEKKQGRWPLVQPCSASENTTLATINPFVDVAYSRSLCFSSGILHQPDLGCFIPELMPLRKACIGFPGILSRGKKSEKESQDSSRVALSWRLGSIKNVIKSPLFTFFTPERHAQLGTLEHDNNSDQSRITLHNESTTCVVGWGHKSTAERARRHARKHALPYIALEDGFLRSLTLASAGYPGMSLVVDHQGIYYDARQPSDLEQLIIESPQRQDAELLQRACLAMQQLREQRLSKYNHAPEKRLPACHKRQRILVVDQTAGDASVEGGMANAQTFIDMLNDACALPDTEVWVKVHPDVIAGKKQGYLLEGARQRGCTLLSDDINPWSLFEQVDAVHVVTSQLGFEAVMAGLPVTCHGVPFYAGWGLTEDRQQCSRRGCSRTLEQVFAAAYLQYSRYANPYTRTAASLEEIIQLLSDQKRQSEKLAGDWIAPGYSRWKQGFLPFFLGPMAQLTFEKNDEDALKRLQTNASTTSGLSSSRSRVLSWASRTTPAFAKEVATHGGELWRIEDGFLRSVGLGVDLVRPLSLILDARAMHFDASVPSTLEGWLENHQLSEVELERARSLRERITSLGLSKYNSETDELPDIRALAQDREVILVVGQVESDASIRHACPGIKTNQALLEAARKLHPDAYVIYKPHPDVVSGGRAGGMAKTASSHDLELTAGNISQLFAQVDHLHTLCSLAGFEALLRGVTVTTHGMPFYAGWGLTRDQLDCPRRTRRLSLDALVAGALIEYPVYVAPKQGHLCNAETVVTILEQQRETLRHGTLTPSLPWKTRLYRGYRALFIGKH